MQGHRSSLTTLPENIAFDNGSTSGDAGIDSQVSWNSMQSDANIQYLNQVRHEGLNGQWSLGETSSGAAQSHHDLNERKREHIWSIHSRAALNLEESSNILSLDNNVTANSTGNQTTNRLHIAGSGPLPQDLNMRAVFGDNEDDDCRVIERPNTYIAAGSSNEYMPSTGISSGLESRAGPGCSIDGRRMSCKRKANEVNVGQSSGTGSSSCNMNMAMQTENELVDSNRPNQAIPRLRLGVGGAVPNSSFSSRGTAESSRRNFRLRINGAHQQDHVPSDPFLPESGSSSNVLLDRMNPAPAAPALESRSPELLHVPFVRRNNQSRWNEASGSRTSSSISRDAAIYEEPLTRNIPRSISEHPMFIPPSEMGSLSQQNYNSVGGSNSIAGSIASSSRGSANPAPGSSAPSWSNRGAHYPRRLSEIVRRSLLSSVGTESGGHNRNYGLRSSSSAATQEMALPSGSHGNYRSNSRAALLERHLDGAIPVPFALRNMTAAGEGRSSIMSEIRRVLDLMRRGEGLRFEDVMMLDHSVFFGMADIHDRHRDMRLDVDNMSYEELLALGERIGNVCTGLNEETIMSHLKMCKFVDAKAEDHVETEPCSICREEYSNGEDLGTLECGHDFHRDCIKQWLMQKNLCPICKTTGLKT